MTEMQFNDKKLQVETDTKKQVADADRAEKERASKRQLVGNIVGGVLGAGSKLGSAYLSSAYNDKAWYNKNKSLVESVANVSFEAPFGATYVGGHRVSGVCIFDYLPLLPHTQTGPTNVVDNTLTLSFQALYATMRAKNSGARNYEPKDLNKYALAMTSYYVVVSEAKKIYDLVQTFSSDNSFYGKRLLEAYNIDESVISDLPELKALIEYHAQASEVYSLPDEMSVVTRQVWLNSAIFADHNMIKSQIYMFRPVGYYQIFSATSTSLQFKVFPWINSANKCTVASLRKVLDGILTQLLSDPYATIISGDLRKAYPKGSYYKITSDIKFVPMLPKYSEEVLSQIENATIVGMDTSKLVDGMFDVTQSAGNDVLYQELPVVNYINPENNEMFVPYRSEEFLAFINMYKNDVDPDDVMVATRLQAQIDIIGRSSDKVVQKIVKSCGTELLLNARLLCVARDRETSEMNTEIVNFCTYMNGPDESNGVYYVQDYNLVNNLDVISQFDWLPGYYAVSLRLSPKRAYVSKFISEFKNLASLTWNKQQALHKVAGLSEYGLTTFASE